MHASGLTIRIRTGGFAGLSRGLRLCLLLTLAFPLAGCVRRPPDTTADGRTIVSYWEKWTGFEGEAMDAVVDAFNQSQDRILVKKLVVSQIDQKVLLATAGGNPPDVCGLWSWAVPVYAEKGALTPLDRRLAEAGISREDYVPVFWDLCGHRGFMWALPSTPATLALHWNRTMFIEAGLDPDRPPQSLAELGAMADLLTIVKVDRDGEPVNVRYPDLTPEEKAAKDFEIVQMGHVPNEPDWFVTTWGFWFGADLWDGDRMVTTDAPQMLEAFTWYRSYTEKFGVSNVRKFGASFGNFSSPQNPFLGSQVAMVLQGVWMYNFIDKYAPHLDWAAAPFPSIDPERLPDVTLAECDVLVIPKGARHPDEAFEFIRFVNSQEAMEKLNLGQRKFSPLANVSEDFVEKHPNPFIETFIDLAHSPNARTVPRISIWTEYSTEITVAANQIFNLLQTPEEALGYVRGRTQWKFDRVNRRWDRVKDQRLAQWKDYDQGRTP